MDGLEVLSPDEPTVQAFVAALMVCMARPFGLLLGFYPFVWVFGLAVLLRISIAFALALPVIAAEAPELLNVVQSKSMPGFVVLIVVEFALGFGMGILASLPLKALAAAGAVSDQYRGEFEGALSSATGAPMHTSSGLYLAIGTYVFFALGGLWLLIGGLYRTYAIWPVREPLPPFEPFAATLSLGLLDSLMVAGLVIGAPLLLLMLGVDAGLAMAARLGRRYRLFDLSFLAKNLAMLIALPVVAVALVQVAEDMVPGTRDLPEIMNQLFR